MNCQIYIHTILIFISGDGGYEWEQHGDRHGDGGDRYRHGDGDGDGGDWYWHGGADDGVLHPGLHLHHHHHLLHRHSCLSSS